MSLAAAAGGGDAPFEVVILNAVKDPVFRRWVQLLQFPFPLLHSEAVILSTAKDPCICLCHAAAPARRPAK
jgi:hypothetical protein